MLEVEVKVYYAHEWRGQYCACVFFVNCVLLHGWIQALGKELDLTSFVILSMENYKIWGDKGDKNVYKNKDLFYGIYLR